MAKRQVQNFHSSIICNNKKLGAIQMPISNRIDKLQYVYTIKHQTGLKMKELDPTTHIIMDDSLEHKFQAK